MSIEEIAKKFGKAYFDIRTASSKHDQLKEKLYKEFDNRLSKNLSARTIQVDSDTNIEEHVKTFYPGYRVKEVLASGTDVIIEEDPRYLKYEFPNPDDGYVYGRTVSQGASSLDDESLKADHPEVWERITEWPEPWASLIRKAIETSVNAFWEHDEWTNEEDAKLDTVVFDFLTESGLQRVLKDFNTISKEDRKIVDQYLVPGPLTVRLIPPRKAKPEELE